VKSEKSKCQVANYTHEAFDFNYFNYYNLTPNNTPQEYRILHFFPFHFSLNNVSLFVNISDVFRPFDALRIAMFIASL